MTIAEQMRAEGEAKGRAVRTRLEAANELEQVEAWLTRAATVDDADALFRVS